MLSGSEQFSSQVSAILAWSAYIQPSQISNGISIKKNLWYLPIEQVFREVVKNIIRSCWCVSVYEITANEDRKIAVNLTTLYSVLNETSISRAQWRPQFNRVVNLYNSIIHFQFGYIYAFSIHLVFSQVSILANHYTSNF